MNAANKKYTVLLLSAPIGSGHKLAAEALEQVFAANKAVHVVHGNIFDFFPHFLGTGFLKVYLQMLQHFPWMYKYMYKWGNQEKGSLWMKNLINGILARLGQNYLEKVAPDAVIATHATPAGIIGIYKKSLPKKLFLGAVITDFTIHKWWICPGVDTYFIADKRLTDRLPENAEVHAYGIPVRQNFMQVDGSILRQELGINDGEKICLLLGGGEGLLPMAEIVTALQEKENMHNISIIAVTGHNKQLFDKLQQCKADRLTVYGFTERLPEIMAAADIVVSKAGGLTSAEVLSLGKKFIIYKPLPGQEEGNAAFLHRHCGAVIAKSTAEVAAFVQAFSEQEAEELQADKERLLAAEKICDCVLKHIRQNEIA